MINYDVNISNFSFYWVISEISQENQEILVKPKGVELVCNFQRMYNYFFVCVKQVTMFINAFSNLQIHRNKSVEKRSYLLYYKSTVNYIGTFLLRSLTLMSYKRTS